MPKSKAPSALLPILELRRYELHPGALDTLVDVFERALIEGQEATGMILPGQFRDMDDPDRFVWLRQFPDMESRRKSLAAFYDGPVWKANSDAANATMIAFDNVLLLKPSRDDRGFDLEGVVRPGLDTERVDRAFHAATIVPIVGGKLEAFANLFEAVLRPILNESGFRIVGSFVTDSSRNTYPDLPVREANVCVWFAQFADAEEHKRALEWLSASPAWVEAMKDRFGGLAAGDLEVLRLQPTRRSLLG